MPEGWNRVALIAKATGPGGCSYTDLATGKITAAQFFELLRIADWRNWIEAQKA